MKIKVLTFYISLSLLLAWTGCEQKTEKSDKIQWLKDNALKIQTINPDDTAYSDLLPLKNIIGDSVDIVMLGERLYGDGSTFSAKIRLIKFLHEKMGYDVLAFENGIYDCWRAWDEVKKGLLVQTAFRNAVIPLWSSADELIPLEKYLQSQLKSGTPLELAGYDCYLSGDYSKQEFYNELDSLKIRSLDSLTHESLNSMIMFYSGVNEPFKTQPVVIKGYQLKLKNVMDELIARNSTDSKTLIIIKAIEGVIRMVDLQFSKLLNSNLEDNPALAGRDIQMANNLTWLKEKFYKNKKIIIWGSSFHTMRGENDITIGKDTVKTYSKYETMGNILWKQYGKKIYSIGFISYNGESREPDNGTSITREESGPNSLEALLNETGYEYCMIDMRNPNKDGNWLYERITCRTSIAKDMNASWPKLFDAFFFIKTMKASKL